MYPLMTYLWSADAEVQHLCMAIIARLTDNPAIRPSLIEDRCLLHVLRVLNNSFNSIEEMGTESSRCVVLFALNYCHCLP